MTDEKIFELASKYLHYDVDGDKAYEWRGESYELLKFARAFYEIGVWDGEIKGYYNATRGRAID